MNGMDNLKDIYIKSVINGEKLSNKDVQEIVKMSLNHIADDDFRYNIYVKQIKTEAWRVINLFKDWYNDKNTIISITNYAKFYVSIVNTFQYDVYRNIYSFFNPIVFKNNFIDDNTLSDDSNKCMLMNSDFIITMLAKYLYQCMLTKDQYICNDIDWKKKYIEPIYSYVNNILFFECMPDYDKHIDTDYSYKQEQMEKDPRYLFN